MTCATCKRTIDPMLEVVVYDWTKTAARRLCSACERRLAKLETSQPNPSAPHADPRSDPRPPDQPPWPPIRNPDPQPRDPHLPDPDPKPLHG